MLNVKDYRYKVSAAGRVNIIGEHIDYCGGKVFPAALSLRNTVYVRPNGTDKINISWTTLPDSVSLDINNLESYRGLKYGNYQAGSAFFWREAGHKIIGCDMIQDCTVPFGSGLSSSAAIEVSTIAALAAVTGESLNNVEAALAANRAEREYAGTNCGIMDQYASACGKKDYAMLLDCKTLNCEYVPLNLGKYALIIMDCNKPHNLVESKYNERRAETEEALETLKKYVDLDCLADLSAEEFSKYSHVLHGKLRDRAAHVVNECERVRLAVSAMKAGNIEFLGKLLNASHASLSKLYEVTGRELDALAAAAQSHPACVGSRMTGGGFGGSAVSIVLSEEAEDFIAYVTDRYYVSTGYKAVCHRAEISDGITVEKI